MSYIWNRIVETFDSLFTNVYIPKITAYDVLEIAIITILAYFIAKAFKNTRTWVLVKGSMILVVLYSIAYLLSFNVITKIFESIILILVIGIVVIFSPEIKKFLEKIGTRNIKAELSSLILRNNKTKHKIANDTIEEIVAACEQMSKDKTGALIVYEDNIPLNDYAETGIKMDSAISRQLLLNIFEHNTPLHDGAIVVKNDIIKAATCYLPLSENKNISKKHGTRHRAAVGISEATDAFTIVVSEETGRISITRNGQITSVSPDGLREELTKFQNETATKEKVKFADIFKNNIAIKIFSILFGIVLWVIIMSASNPIMTTTINDVPVNVINEEAITDMNKVYTLNDELFTTVKVTGHRSDIEDVSKEDIVVIADLSLLSEINTVRLSASSLKPDLDVKIVNEIMQINIEKCIEAEFDVVAKKEGTEDSSVYVYEMVSEIKKVRISGPESLIRLVKRIEFKIDVTDCKRDFYYTATPTLYDKNDKEIVNENIKISVPKLVFHVKTLKTKEVTLVVTPKCDSYIKQYINTFSAVPSVIVIAANDRLLENTDVLEVAIPIDLEYEDLFNDTYTKEVDISEYVAEGFYIPDANKKVDIVVGFASDAMREIYFNFADIELRNFDETKYIIRTAQDKFSVSIFGDKDAILSANIGKLKPYIDLSMIQQGENVLFIEFAGGSNFMISSNNKVTIFVEEIIVIPDPPDETEPPDETSTPDTTEPPETSELVDDDTSSPDVTTLPIVDPTEPEISVA